MPHLTLLYRLKLNPSRPSLPQLGSSRSLKPRWWTSPSTSLAEPRTTSSTKSRSGWRPKNSTSCPSMKTMRCDKTRIASMLRSRSSRQSSSRQHWCMNHFRATWKKLSTTLLIASRSCIWPTRMPGTTPSIAQTTGTLSESRSMKTKRRRSPWSQSIRLNSWRKWHQSKVLRHSTDKTPSAVMTKSLINKLILTLMIHCTSWCNNQIFFFHFISSSLSLPVFDTFIWPISQYVEEARRMHR